MVDNSSWFVRNEPVIDPPIDVLQRYNARVLDPITAPRLADQVLRTTVFIADRLLVSRQAPAPTVDALRAAADELGLTLHGLSDSPPSELRMRAYDVAKQADLDPQSVPYRVGIAPADDATSASPNGWAVLQSFRGRVGGDEEQVAAVGLDHLLSAARQTHGSPFNAGGPATAALDWGPGQYGQPGYGARMPVCWSGAAPKRRPDDGRRRPVVAVIDTGVSTDHDWLRVGVDTEPMALGFPIPPETTGVTDYPLLGWLDNDAGHGTFIAGVVRQHCADANIVSIQVMAGDGSVAQSDLVDALHLLLRRQQDAIASEDPSQLIDIVCLSLGYYHEQGDDGSSDSFIADPLRQLGELGVAVVVAAGNDSTTRPMYPAALADPAPPSDTGVARVPLVSVGALNPNSTIALFSNAGDWVTCHRMGAAVVSTLPPKFNGSRQPTTQLYDPADPPGSVRATIDSDDFRGGFGVWSGTSFAAPVLAGEIAAQLCDMDLSGFDPQTMRDRCWAALQACVPREEFPQ